MSEINVKEIMEGVEDRKYTTPQSRNADFGKALFVREVAPKEATSDALQRVRVYTEVANMLREQTSTYSYYMDAVEIDKVESIQEQFRLLINDMLDKVGRTW